jgi:signal transduction histidine kinase
MNDAFLNSTIVISVLIGIIILFFVFSIINYHRRYIQLQRERIHAEITIQENERKRIANDLHDSLGPLLSSVKLNINSIDVVTEEDKKIIDKAGRHIDEIIKSLRQISYNLLPNTLDRKGLVAAINEFTEIVNQKSQLHIVCHVIKPPSLAKEKEIHIFRMLQEIVQNTLKHAKAKTLQIGLAQEDGFLLILTKDDGKGFDVNRAKEESTGLGLKSLESRKEILHGQLIIESSPEQGTNHFIKIPI